MLETKQCNTCNLTKNVDQFSIRKIHGKYIYFYKCKLCVNINGKKEYQKYLINNPKKSKDIKHCNKCNTTKSITQFRLTKIRGKIGRDHRCQDCIKKLDKIKYQKLLEKFKQQPNLKTIHYKNQRISVNKRLENDPTFYITTKCRDRFKDCLRSGREWYDYLGCSINFLKLWIEYQFQIFNEFKTYDIELSWKNRSKWHIDHTVPCDAFDFNNKEQIKICFHWSNLSPMPSHDNISKSSKIIPQLIKRQITLATIYKNITGNYNDTVKIAEICDETGALDTAALEKFNVQQVE